MNSIKIPQIILFSSALASAIAAAEPTAATSTPTPANPILDAIAKGKVSLNLRARYENVDQTNLLDANALTFRTRLGFTTAPAYGFKAMIEAENIASPSGDDYNQAGLNPAGSNRAVVADPETTEMNQAWLAYTFDKTTATLGRQRLAYDNARFIGDVAWRQNMQTFDAINITDKSIEKLTLNYAYLNRVNRVFGDRHAQGNWDTDSHLLNLSTAAIPYGSLTGYAYLLDFNNAAAQSCATYGVSFAGNTPLNDTLKLLYRAELALQSDYADQPTAYEAEYYNLELGLGRVFKIEKRIRNPLVYLIFCFARHDSA